MGITGKKWYDAKMVVVDSLSKRAHFVPTTGNASANNTAHLYYENVFRLHGLPTKIVSDKDGRFTSLSGKPCFKIAWDIDWQ